MTKDEISLAGLGLLVVSLLFKSWLDSRRNRAMILATKKVMIENWDLRLEKSKKKELKENPDIDRDLDFILSELRKNSKRD